MTQSKAHSIVIQSRFLFLNSRPGASPSMTIVIDGEVNATTVEIVPTNRIQIFSTILSSNADAYNLHCMLTNC